MKEINGKTVVVTGGAGFIGSNLVARLVKDNRVYVIDNMHTGSEENLAEFKKLQNLKLIKMDVEDINQLAVDADYVFHLAFPSASPMYREDPKRVGHAILGTINVLEYAKRTGAHVVYASTSSIYNGMKPPHTEGMMPLVTDYYTEARIAVERLFELYNLLHGVNSVGLRFFSVYGPREKAKGKYANLVTQFLWGMKENKRPVIYGDGEQRRDFVYVEDVVDAMIQASGTKGCEVFNVGTGRNYSLNELVEKLNARLGKNIKAEYIKMPVSNYVMETLADTKKAETKHGFKTRYSLDDGIKKIAEYY